MKILNGGAVPVDPQDPSQLTFGFKDVPASGSLADRLWLHLLDYEDVLVWDQSHYVYAIDASARTTGLWADLATIVSSATGVLNMFPYRFDDPGRADAQALYDDLAVISSDLNRTLKSLPDPKRVTEEGDGLREPLRTPTERGGTKEYAGS